MRSSSRHPFLGSGRQCREYAADLRYRTLNFVAVIVYIRARRRLWPAAGLLVGLILMGWDVAVAAPTFISQYAVRNDFRLAYAAAKVGVKDGYGHLYDLAAQKAAIESLGPGVARDAAAGASVCDGAGHLDAAPARRAGLDLVPARPAGEGREGCPPGIDARGLPGRVWRHGRPARGVGGR